MSFGAAVRSGFANYVNFRGRAARSEFWSGWWVLVAFLPVIGWLVLFYFLVSPGTPGPNQFGPPPGSAFSAAGPKASYDNF